MFNYVRIFLVDDIKEKSLFPFLKAIYNPFFEALVTNFSVVIRYKRKIRLMIWNIH